MTGNVTVVNHNSNGAASNSTSSTFDAVGALMVPSTMVQDVVGEMRRFWNRQYAQLQGFTWWTIRHRG
ncbi:MAG TPA: hypothetical protein VFR94_13815 [Nitrososphaeraceae archaeon]|nr:hypothetical protein [Nitrososphaeraceae archaeon]